MGTRYIIGDLVTGRRIVNLPVISGSWSDDLDVPETVSATVKLNNAVIRTLDLTNTATEAKTFLAAIDTGPFGQAQKVLAAGPLWDVDYNRPAQTLQLTARGILSIFDHYFVLPLAARTLPTNQWTISDPADPSGVGTLPNPAVATVLSGVSLGGQIIQLIQQAMSWPGASLPLVLPAVEAGTTTNTWQGIEGKKVWAAISDIMKRENGPELNAAARLTLDGLGIEWVVTVGTTAEPLIYSPTVTGWNVTSKESPVKSLTISRNASGMASLSWATGGRQNDTVILSRVEDDTLIDLGYPLLQTWDSTHSDVVVQSTLDDYALANIRSARSPAQTWAFVVKAHPVDARRNAAGPQLDDYDVGDFIRLHVDPYDDETGRGDLFMPGGGDFDLRIVGIAGDHIGENVTIKCAPVVS
jgi:hypothetical protein